MKLIVYILILVIFCRANAQQHYERGKLIDSIAVSNTTDETFALYLPTSFEAFQPSPILFIFEPAGRGRLGVETFINASESFGHILVCSNNSRNGPYEWNFSIAANLFDHVFERFNVDEDQMFLAGFSGGSRLAWAIATAAGNITGVIACGAGFSETASPILQKQEFSYVGICGNEDMNYREMLEVSAYLAKSNQDHILITFDGGHSWPPPEEIAKAFDWLALESHRKRKKIMPEDEIYRSYLRNYEIAKKTEAEGSILDASEDYQRILSTYDAMYEMDTIASRLKDIKKRREYKQVLRDRNAALEKEKEWTSVFYERFTADYNQPEKSDMHWWENKLTQLNDKYANSTLEYQKMLKRVRFNLFAMAYSKNNPNLHQSSEPQKRFCITLGKLIHLD
jgi:pimeloyl-ACP methyl ester carboxylesterase